MPAAATQSTWRSWRITENQNACADEQLRRQMRTFEAVHRREVARIAAECRQARGGGGGSGSSSFPYLEKRNAIAVRSAARAEGPGSRTLQLARSAMARLRAEAPVAAAARGSEETVSSHAMHRQVTTLPPMLQLQLLSERRAAELLAGAERRRLHRLEAARASGRSLEGRVSEFGLPPLQSRWSTGYPGNSAEAETANIGYRSNREAPVSTVYFHRINKNFEK